MSKTAIRSQIRQIKKRLKEAPRVLRFRGKRVVPTDRWTLEDWTTFPDEYHIAFSLWVKPPTDWWKDYLALLTKLEDPTFARNLCYDCAIDLARKASEDVKMYSWDDRGGEEAKEKFYKTCPEWEVNEFRREDAMRKTHLRLYNETAGANNRTCNILNYFKCPYGQERDELIHRGRKANRLWDLVEYYDRHWNPNHSEIPSEDQKKWYHQSDPGFIDVTNLEDTLKAEEDGRIQKIAKEKQEHDKIYHF